MTEDDDVYMQQPQDPQCLYIASNSGLGGWRVIHMLCIFFYTDFL